MAEAIRANSNLKSRNNTTKKKFSQEEIRRVLNLLQSAQFDLGRKTDSVKIIRRERSS
ncbi:MAG: hypothetical protein HY960_04760 [Ignavibacteriae bacterium]|nr:hypothetical protein [Ignavibacteriota bacterium]